MQQHPPAAAHVRKPNVRAPFVWVPGIAECIASFLPPNEVACTIRLLDKATAAQFRSPWHTTVRLSQPTPSAAFTAHWGRPSALRSLSRSQRRRLVSLTASTGVLTNLAFALDICGCTLRSCALEAAAAGGQVGACRWLRARGCAWGRALAAAARAGQYATCEWLLANGCAWDHQAVCAAARGGHLELLNWLLARVRAEGAGTDGAMQLDGCALLAATAEGCGLGLLQRLHDRLVAGEPLGQEGSMLQEQAHEPPEQEAKQEAVQEAVQEHAPDGQMQLELQGPQMVQQQQASREGRRPQWSPPSAGDLQVLLAAAGRSPTTDWTAKLQWLQAQGSARTCPPDAAAAACAAAASRPPDDAARRLAWLQQRGYTADVAAADAAASSGNLAALECLLDQGVPVGYRAGTLAASHGHVGILQALHARQCRLEPFGVLMEGARSGHLGVLEWVEGARGVPRRAEEWLQVWAAHSGRVEVLAWAVGRGLESTEAVFRAAAGAGCEEAVEWLVERRCPMGSRGDAYVMAALHGDLATLRCLRRLGCPWGPVGGRAPGGVFARCVRAGCESATLRCCLELGCPLPDGEAWEGAGAATGLPGT